MKTILIILNLLKSLKFNLVNYETIFFVANGLSMYIKAGIPIRKAINIIKKAINKKHYIEALERIESYIDNGYGIGEAFIKEREVFTDDFVDMIVMAEESGRIEEILEILAKQFERNNIMKKEIKKKLSYPILLISTMIIVLNLIIIFVLPTLTSMYKDMSGELNKVTKIVIAISDFVEQNNMFLLVSSFVMISIILFLLFKEIFKGKDLVGNLKTVKKYRELKLILILNLIIKGGIPIAGAVNKLKISIKDKYTKKNLEIISVNLHEGNTFSESIKSTGILSYLSESFICSGEESGNLEEAVEKLSTILEYELNLGINKLIFLIEPISIFILGILVLFLVLMVFIPMYEYMNYV